MITGSHDASSSAKRDPSGAAMTQKRKVTEHLVLCIDLPDSDRGKSLSSINALGQRKMKICHLPLPCNLNEETARQMLVSYVAGTCSPADKTDFETHCSACHECCLMLLVVLHVLRPSTNNEEEEALASLYPIGIEAATIVRWVLEE